VDQALFSVESLSLAWRQAVWYTTLGMAGGIAAALVPARKARRP